MLLPPWLLMAPSLACLGKHWIAWLYACVCVHVCVSAWESVSDDREKSRAIRCWVNIPPICSPLPLCLCDFHCARLLTCLCMCLFISKFARLSVCLCVCPPSCLHIYTPPSLSAKPTVSVCLHVLHSCLSSLIPSNFLILCLCAIWIQYGHLSTCLLQPLHLSPFACLLSLSLEL